MKYDPETQSCQIGIVEREIIEETGGQDEKFWAIAETVKDDMTGKEKMKKA